MNERRDEAIPLRLMPSGYESGPQRVYEQISHFSLANGHTLTHHQWLCSLCHLEAGMVGHLRGKEFTCRGMN
jgi:hypothetical protein